MNFGGSKITFGTKVANFTVLLHDRGVSSSGRYFSIKPTCYFSPHGALHVLAGFVGFAFWAFGGSWGIYDGCASRVSDLRPDVSISPKS